MTTEEQIEFTVAVFSNVLHDRRDRIAAGIRRREEAHELAQQGKTNYRTEWVRDSVLRVVDTLAEIARDFDAKHPDDQCTTKDFGDILMSTIRALQSLR